MQGEIKRFLTAFVCAQMLIIIIMLPGGGARSGWVEDDDGPKHCLQLFPREGVEDPVVSNVTTLALRSPEKGDTGWLMQMELVFTREPPVYGSGDESIDLDCTLMVYRSNDALAQRKPPIRVGHVVTGKIFVHGQLAMDIELVPLLPPHDGEKSMLISYYHVMLAMNQLRSPQGERFCGLLHIKVHVDLPSFGDLSSEVTCTIETPSVDPLEGAWSMAPTSGLLGHCLSEAHYDDGYGTLGHEETCVYVLTIHCDRPRRTKKLCVHRLECRHTGTHTHITSS